MSKRMLIVSDVGGTIWDFGGLSPARTIGTILTAHQVAVDEATIRAHMGKKKREHIAAILDLEEAQIQWEQAHGSTPTESDIDAIEKRFIEMEGESAAMADPVPGAADVFNLLRSGQHLVGLTTGYPEEVMDMIEPRMAAMGIHWDVAFSSSSVPTARPAPWLIFRCMEACNIQATSAVVKIGDTEADMRAGRNAGVFTVGVIDSGVMVGLSQIEFASADPGTITKKREAAEKRLRAAGAHLTVNDISELPAIIDVLSRLG